MPRDELCSDCVMPRHFIKRRDHPCEIGTTSPSKSQKNLLLHDTLPINSRQFFQNDYIAHFLVFIKSMCDRGGKS
jgi:hypothetical protein